MDHHDAVGSRRFTLLAVAFELSLGILALLLGWLTGPWPARTLTDPAGTGTVASLLMGAALAVPLFAGVVLMDRRPVGMFHELQRIVREQVVPLFRGASLGDLLLISLAAGIGEELLFRGYVQAAVADWIAPPWGMWVAITCASLLFGVCHWLCLAYALLAAAMGILLGTLFAATGNLLAPITAHAVYDFLALLYLVRRHDRPAEPSAGAAARQDELID